MFQRRPLVRSRAFYDLRDLNNPINFFQKEDKKTKELKSEDVTSVDNKKDYNCSDIKSKL